MDKFNSVGHFEDEEIEELFDSIVRMLEELYYNYREDRLKIPTDEKIIKEICDIERLDGKVPGVHNSRIGHGGSINVIPPDRNSKGRCVSIIIVFCFSKNKLNERLRELVYHLGIYCRRITKKVLIVTNQWDNDIWQLHLPALEILKSQENIKIFKAQLDGNKFIKTILL